MPDQGIEQLRIKVTVDAFSFIGVGIDHAHDFAFVQQGYRQQCADARIEHAGLLHQPGLIALVAQEDRTLCADRAVNRAAAANEGVAGEFFGLDCIAGTHAPVATIVGTEQEAAPRLGDIDNAAQQIGDQTLRLGAVAQARIPDQR
jgi:hypothetical protein